MDSTTTQAARKPSLRNDADHTILSGVVIDWGHGWGWGHNGWMMQSAMCGYESAMSGALHCHGVEDCVVNGYEDVDWSAFGDFCF